MAEGGEGVAGYAPGRSEGETDRLIRQARLTNPGMQWLLERAGLAPGMRVLDVGTGAGDAAMLAARMVGPGGSVVGVDLDPAVLEVAHRRAADAGLANVSFVGGDLRGDLGLDGDFDALIGRSILVHLADPAATLRFLVRRVRPGGVVAFREAAVSGGAMFVAYPESPLLDLLERWVARVVERLGDAAVTADPQMGMRLRRVFLDAGLPEPQVHLEAPMGGGADWEGYEYIAETLRMAAPILLKLGIAEADEIDPGTFASRLRAETVRQRGVIRLAPNVLAWSRKP
jgi:ubiquinone/menaquinone biosynthesis C-methylase UbiE